MLSTLIAHAARIVACRRGVTAAETALIAASLVVLVTVAGNGLTEVLSAAFSRVIGSVIG